MRLSLYFRYRRSVGTLYEKSEILCGELDVRHVQMVRLLHTNHNNYSILIRLIVRCSRDSSMRIFNLLHIVFFLNFLGGFFLFLFVLYSALLHLPALRFRCADGCWDRTQDRCNWCIGSQTL